MLRAVGEEEQHLGLRAHGPVRGMEEQLADGAADGGSSRLLGQHRVRTESPGEKPRLGALPAAFHPLERDERHGHRILPGVAL